MLVEKTQTDQLNEKYVRYILKLANNFKNDVYRETRIGSRKCLKCFYTEVVSGRAIVKSECVICKSTIKNQSTIRNKVCTLCSEKYKLCRQCGGSMEINLDEI